MPLAASGNTVAVVDYGMGNLRSVSQAMHAVAADSGFQVIVTSDPDQVRAAGRIVLPGQGAMPDCMRELHASGLVESGPLGSGPGAAAVVAAGLAGRWGDRLYSGSRAMVNGSSSHHRTARLLQYHGAALCAASGFQVRQQGMIG